MKNMGRLIEEDVSREVSQMIADELDLDVSQVRSGASFLDLHPDFDSLTLIQIQNLLEEHFGFPLALDLEQGAIPMCLNEFVALIMRCAPRDFDDGAVVPSDVS